ncbi:putative monoglyceride lipase, partial [Teratosphaeria destructans]
GDAAFRGDGPAGDAEAGAGVPAGGAVRGAAPDVATVEDHGGAGAVGAEAVAEHADGVQVGPEARGAGPRVAEEIEADPLCHNTGTLEGLAGMLDRAAALEAGTVTVPEGRGEGGKTRVWFGMGTVDLICDYAAVRELYERMPVADKTFETYEGWYHKLHLEPGEDKVRFCNDVVRWILEKAREGGAGERPKL